MIEPMTVRQAVRSLLFLKYFFTVAKSAVRSFSRFLDTPSSTSASRTSSAARGRSIAVSVWSTMRIVSDFSARDTSCDKVSSTSRVVPACSIVVKPKSSLHRPPRQVCSSRICPSVLAARILLKKSFATFFSRPRLTYATQSVELRSIPGVLDGEMRLKSRSTRSHGTRSTACVSLADSANVFRSVKASMSVMMNSAEISRRPSETTGCIALSLPFPCLSDFCTYFLSAPWHHIANCSMFCSPQSVTQALRMPRESRLSSKERPVGVVPPALPSRSCCAPCRSSTMCEKIISICKKMESITTELVDKLSQYLVNTWGCWCSTGTRKGCTSEVGEKGKKQCIALSLVV
mmetsp:Transcript_33207/g.93079  ORF Transcript_33207/g.93079 Transcript_33207/m.93079 type:complete len:347 (+) Transcript_33207:4765-5805(+)